MRHATNWSRSPPPRRRGFDGRLAEFAAWDRILSADEFASLEGVGIDGPFRSPLFIPRGLKAHTPMRRALIDHKGDPATATGTPTVIEHPPMIYPGETNLSTPAAAPAPEKRRGGMMLRGCGC